MRFLPIADEEITKRWLENAERVLARAKADPSLIRRYSLTETNAGDKLLLDVSPAKAQR